MANLPGRMTGTSPKGAFWLQRKSSVAAPEALTANRVLEKIRTVGDGREVAFWEVLHGYAVVRTQEDFADVIRVWKKLKLLPLDATGIAKVLHSSWRFAFGRQLRQAHARAKTGEKEKALRQDAAHIVSQCQGLTKSFAQLAGVPIDRKFAGFRQQVAAFSSEMRRIAQRPTQSSVVLGMRHAALREMVDLVSVKGRVPWATLALLVNLIAQYGLRGGTRKDYVTAKDLHLEFSRLRPKPAQ